MEQNLTVLIDFENIVAGTEKEGLGRFDINLVFRRLKDKGRIMVARAYADWGRFARFKSTLLEQGVTMMELTSHGMHDKNRADIALVVDAMELAFTRPHLDTFVVLSGDSDFTPLVLRLKELNKRVIGCGTRGSTSHLIVGACDEFIFYDSLLRPVTPSAEPRRAPPTRAPEPPRAEVTEPAPGREAASTRDAREVEPRTEERPARQLDLESALDLLLETLVGLQADDPNALPAGQIKSGMLRKESTFNERDLGFPGFGRFLEEAHRRKRVALVRDPRSGSYLVDVFKTGGPEPLQEEPSEPAAAPDLSRAFDLLVVTLQALQGTGPINSSIVKSEMLKRDAAFDERALGFSGFARFLEAAEDASRIRLARGTRASGYQVNMQQAGGAPPAPVENEEPAGEPETLERTFTRPEDAFRLVVEALRTPALATSRTVHASLLKPVMARLAPEFNERDMGFASFGRLLEAASKEGLIRLSAGRKAGGYFVTLVSPGAGATDVEEPLEPQVPPQDAAEPAAPVETEEKAPDPEG